jgi:hypothetical protein
MKPLIQFTVLTIILMTILGVLINAEDSSLSQPSSSEIDYTNSASIANAPANQVDISQAISNGNGQAVTAEQWAYGNNLNHAEDLSSYPQAQEAVNVKHPGYAIELSSGHATYNDGVLSNGNGPTIDLKNNDLKGTLISALVDGGFRIERRGSTGKFIVAGLSLDLSAERDTSADIKEDKIILSRGAEVIDRLGSRVLALRDGVSVRTRPNSLEIEGIALVRDMYGNRGVIGDGNAARAGIFSLFYPNGEYRLQDASLLLQEGRLTIDNSYMESSSLVLLSSGAERIIKKLADTLADSEKKATLRALDQEIRQNMDVDESVGALATASRYSLVKPKVYNNPSATFTSLFGLSNGQMNPFLTASIPGESGGVTFRADSTQARTDVNIDTLTGYVAVTASSGSRFRAGLDLGDQGEITIASSSDFNNRVEYRRTLGGKIKGALIVHNNPTETRAFAGFDLSPILN